MAKRVRVKGDLPAPAGNVYNLPTLSGVKCIPTGCTTLDCVLGGGWGLGRIANIVGDKAVGKTLLAIEACANFAHQNPEGRIFYRESEAAFDASYAETLGLPLDRVDFGPEGIETQWETIEDVFEDLDARLTEVAKAGVAALYIVDSLDALSSRAELARKPGEGTFGLEKQKALGELFRKLVRRIKVTNCAVIFVSQIRDKIGITFGEKHTRSGGKALDFYASQILWLHHLKQLGSTRGGAKRVTGVRIMAKCKKNKISLPFRQCEFEIGFGYGVRDELASIEWLEEVKALGKLGITSATADAYLDNLDTLSAEELKAEQQRLRDTVLETWTEVEGRFTPRRKKYV